MRLSKRTKTACRRLFFAALGALAVFAATNSSKLWAQTYYYYPATTYYYPTTPVYLSPPTYYYAAPLGPPVQVWFP